MSLRTPTALSDQLAFYFRAIAGAREAVTEKPEAGWWKARLAQRGPWVPVRIWLEQEIDAAGELVAPEILKCTVDGDEKDPRDIWAWCCTRPIAEHEFRYLTALRSWQRINEPEAWDAYKAVDMTETPIEG